MNDSDNSNQRPWRRTLSLLVAALTLSLSTGCSSSSSDDDGNDPIDGDDSSAGGTLDPNFADEGTFTYDWDNESEDQAYGITVLEDDSILLAGEATTLSGSADFALLKLDAIGAIAPDFGDSGRRSYDYESGGGQGGRDLHVDDSGRFLMAGWHFDELAAMRVLDGGAPDADYDSDGLATSKDLSASQITYGSALFGDSLAVIGQYDFSLAVLRLDADGNGLTSFGGDGLVVNDFPDVNEAVGQDGVFLDDGRLLVAGFAVTDSTNRMLLVRYSTDGTLDTTFGEQSGYTLGTFDYLHEAQAIALLPDGKILLAGLALSGFDPGYLVARFNADGTLDTSFGDGGYLFDPGMTAANDIAVTDTGAFYICGSLAEFFGSDSTMTVACHRADGSLNPSFGEEGIGTYPVGTDLGVAKKVVFHGEDGLLVLGDTRNSGSFTDWTLLRVLR